MMRVRAVLTEMNWRHAAAELVLIVLGVTIALAASSWYEGRQRLRDETALLEELSGTLSEDLEGVSAALNTMRGVNQDMRTLVELFESDEFDPEDREHRRLIGSLARFTQVRIRTGPFETLKARGLDLVSSRTLRVRLMSLYDDEFPILQEQTEIDQRLSREWILPYQVEHFDLKQEGWLLKPQHLQEARTMGATLGRYRYQTLERFYLPAFERNVALMTDALAEIEAESKVR